MTSIAATITPLSLLILIFGYKKLGLIGIYIVFGLLGITYNPRGSSAYLYGAEMLPTEKRLMFGSCVFFCDGIVSILASFYFYTYKTLSVFFVIVLTIFTSALTLMVVLLPETPCFLLMRGNIDAYHFSLAKVTG